MKYLSVCSGMEAASVAWHPLGWTPVGFSEIEPFPCAILKHRFPNTPNYGSLTEYQSWPLEPGAIDLLVGGTPCQSFSVAGLRKGLADPRGNLALTFLGLADKLKPRWIVWENVPGVLSSGGGRDFGSFLGALVELGYGFAYRVLDAQHFGVPQRRRRVFVVACLGDWRAAAEVLSLGEGLRGYSEKGRATRKEVTGTLSSRSSAGGGLGTDFDCAGGVQPVYRKSKRAASTTDNETWVPANASNTLNNFDLGDTRTTHAVVQPVGFSMREDAINGTFDVKQVDTSLCLQALRPAVTSHHAQNIVVQPVAWTQNQREEVRLLGDKVGAIALPGTHQTNYIAEPKVYENHAQDSRVTGPLEVAPTVAAKFGTGGGNVPLVGAMAVRRLTPVETERLQGFPDNWSRISWKGKPETECPDGPRYKACGNSMAVPVMRWIGERIAAVDSTLPPHA
jgi:DNA (cytosine-5)-methyltransferase 1